MEETKKCSVSRKCGGCTYSGISYEEQLSKKDRYIHKLLSAYGKVNRIIGMEDPYYYRNKVHHVFAFDRKRGIISGCYEANTHRVVDITLCLIEDVKCFEIIETVKKLCVSFKMKTYDEDTGYGFLRHVLVRRGFSTGEIMVVLITGYSQFSGKNNFVKALLKEHPDITTVIQNINDRKTSMVLSDRENILYGPGFIKDRLCGKTFRISSGSFYQVNPVQTEILYDTAISFAELKGNETVIDAYCGIGTIGLCASSKSARVIGVELNPDAVRDARTNAKENNVKNAAFYKGDAGEFMTAMAEAGEKCDVVFMDPPRSGSTEKFMASCIRLSPERIVYVSCGPETLARDLKYFTAHGYEVVKIQPVDMFPFTEHVETVVLLSKGVVDKDNFRKVKVDFSLEDMDLTELRGKATYAQVKEYILNEFGLKVSSLYIAQVKKKCGIETGENHNLPKSEDARQPQVTPEKEEAIMRAFRHYGVI